MHVVLQNVLFGNDSLLPKSGCAEEIHVSDDVTVKVIDFFLCIWQCRCIALVHSCKQLIQDLMFGCSVMCLCLHFDIVTQLKSFHLNALENMCDGWLEVFMAMVADKCFP